MFELLRAWLALLISGSMLYGGWGAAVPHADPYGTLVLVNKDYKSAVHPPVLVLPDIEPSKKGIESNLYLQPEAAAALEQLFDAAKLEGHLLYGVSGYRSSGTQSAIFERRVGQNGDSAKKWVAPPGYSEHQTGLVMDISGESTVKLGLVSDFGKSKEGIWVAENAHRFGYIIRYQTGWVGVTGYNPEPWHLRYVGVEHAANIYERGIPLEYYLVQLQAETLGSILPTPTPKPTREPTPTPRPTATPKPTRIPEPTDTAQPTATPAPVVVSLSTPTPAKTSAPAVTPSPTPVPTADSTPRPVVVVQPAITNTLPNSVI